MICIVLHIAELVSSPAPPSGWGEREEGLGDNPGWKCPEGMLWSSVERLESSTVDFHGSAEHICAHKNATQPGQLTKHF